MTSLGRSEFEQHILGAASLAVSAFIALLPTLLLWAWRERRTLYVILSLPVFLGFVAFSLSSAVGFAALNRGSLDEDRRLVSARLFEVKRVIEATGTVERTGKHPFRHRLAGGFARSGAGPALAIVEVLRSSDGGCVTHVLQGLFRREGRSGESRRARTSGGEVAELNVERGRLEDRGAGREADNQTAVLAQLLGLPASDVERGLTLFLAVLVEVGAALGIYFATGHMRPEPRRDGREKRRPVIIEGNVVEFARRDEAAPAPLKQIAAPAGQRGPRRVPRLTHS